MISVTIPNYNQGRFLRESIQSVLSQDVKMDVCVLDAGSHDESVGVIKEFSDKITFWRSYPDNGQTAAIIEGLSRARGLYWNWQNGDDILLPGSYKKIIKKFEELGGVDSGVAFVGGYPIIIDESGKITKQNEGYLNIKDGFVNIEEAIRSQIAGLQPGGLFSTKAVRDIGGIDPKIKFSMDRDILLQLLRKYKIYMMAEPVIFFRRHPNQRSEEFNQDRGNERVRILNKFFNDRTVSYKISSEVRRKAYAMAWERAVYWNETSGNSVSGLIARLRRIKYLRGNNRSKAIRDLFRQIVFVLDKKFFHMKILNKQFICFQRKS